MSQAHSKSSLAFWPSGLCKRGLSKMNEHFCLKILNRLWISPGVNQSIEGTVNLSMVVVLGGIRPNVKKLEIWNLNWRWSTRSNVKLRIFWWTDVKSYLIFTWRVLCGSAACLLEEIRLLTLWNSMNLYVYSMFNKTWPPCWTTYMNWVQAYAVSTKCVGTMKPGTCFCIFLAYMVLASFSFALPCEIALTLVKSFGSKIFFHKASDGLWTWK